MKNPLAMYKPIPQAFGLAISDSSLRIINLEKKNSQLSFIGYGYALLSSGIIQEGEIKKEKEFAATMENLLKNSKFLKTHHTIVSLPEQKIFTRVIQLPKIKEKELAEAVQWEAEANIPMPLKEVYLDWQIVKPLQNNLDHFDILITAAPKNLVDSYVAAIEQRGIKVYAIEPESMSISRSVIKNAKTDETVMIIDINASRTNFIIFSGFAPRFTSSAPISGKHFDEAILKTGEAKIEKIEEIKNKMGLDKNQMDGKIFDALIPVLTDLIEQAQKYINFYSEHSLHEHSPEKGVKKILISGSEALLFGLNSYISSELKLPVEIANPWVNVLEEPLKEVPGLTFEKSLSYASALGLAIRGANL